MKRVRGTEGYSKVVERFTRATESLDFNTLHKPFLGFIPTSPGHVLDIGSGTGRDAAMFAKMGHSVVAIEPMPEFLTVAKARHNPSHIEWVDDSLPLLKTLGESPDQFNFILASGVWHHIDEFERQQAMSRISYLLRAGGIFALSLRNGPAGAGTHVFSTDGTRTIATARSFQLEPLMELSGQPSLIKGKDDVKWTYLVLRRVH